MMPFINAIEQFNSVSIVGMAKNTGKTTCLNYVMDRLHKKGVNLAITSIGVDGEERDILYDTPKPRIILLEGMVFITSEKDFDQREFPADVLSVSERITPLGRLVTARANGFGKVVLSGPSDTLWLKESIMGMKSYGVDCTLVDGALSRLSLASPAVTDALILCTGAACSSQLSQVIHKTKFRCRLINLEQVDTCYQTILTSFEQGIWSLNDTTGKWERVGESTFIIENEYNSFQFEKIEKILYAGGAVTNNFLNLLSLKSNHSIELIVRDFTKLFVDPATFDKFIRRGGSVKVLYKPKLLAVITNPVSPEGVLMDPLVLREQMQNALQIPVYDVVNC